LKCFMAMISTPYSPWMITHLMAMTNPMKRRIKHHIWSWPWKNPETGHNPWAMKFVYGFEVFHGHDRQNI
jgi:hypothetical protein